MMNTPVAYQDLFPLLTQLRGAGIELPAQITGAVAILEDSAGLSHEVLGDPIIDPLCADRDQWVTVIRRRAAINVANQQLGPIMWDAVAQITAAVAQVLREDADNIIDQLRARFDQAAKTVHAATTAGIASGTTPDEVIALGPKAIAAWRGLPEHADVLDEIAALRVALTDVLNVAPHDGHFEPRRYAAAFNSRAEWETRDRRSRYGVHRWLRLSAQSEPLRLLTLAETDRLDRESRAPVRPTVDPDGGGFEVSEVVYR